MRKIRLPMWTHQDVRICRTDPGSESEEERGKDCGEKRRLLERSPFCAFIRQTIMEQLGIDIYPQGVYNEENDTKRPAYPTGYMLA